MKYFAIICITILLLSCENKRNSNDLLPKKSERKIKTVRESIHDPFVRNRKVEYRSKISDDSFINSSTFNEDGKVVKESRFNSKGNLQSKVIHKYDKNGNLLESDFYNQTESLISKKINTFNSADRLISSNEIDTDEQLLAKETASFDNEGNRILENYRLLNGVFTKIQESVFDRHENNIENAYFNNGTLVRKEINTYDSSHNKIETIVFLASRNEQDITRCMYDKQNNKIEEVVTKNNLMISKTHSRYDKGNNVIEILAYGINSNLQKHQKLQYQYDDANRWIRQITIVNGRPTSVILREIEYY